MSKNKSPVYLICFCGVMAAVFVVLEYLSVPIGNNYNITVSALPIIITAVALGPVAGMSVGLIGAFISQLIEYGLSVTTPLWILPAGIRGLIIGLLFIAFKKSLKYKVFIPQIIFSSLIVTVLNTVITYIDSRIFGYPFAVAALSITIKIALSIVTAAVLSVITPPIVKAVNKYIER